MLKDARGTSSNLYDGGWRIEDRDWLKEEYGFTEDELDTIIKYFEKFENNE